MIAWEYATIFVLVRGSTHVVAAINGQPTEMQRSPQTPWDVLNAMGAEGWELVSTLPTTPLRDVPQGKPPAPVASCDWIFYLKRPKLAEA